MVASNKAIVTSCVAVTSSLDDRPKPKALKAYPENAHHGTFTQEKNTYARNWGEGGIEGGLFGKLPYSTYQTVSVAKLVVANPTVAVMSDCL